MSNQAPRNAEHLVTLVSTVKFLTGVGPFAKNQIATGTERLASQVTAVRFPITESSFMIS